MDLENLWFEQFTYCKNSFNIDFIQEIEMLIGHLYLFVGKHLDLYTSSKQFKNYKIKFDALFVKPEICSDVI